ncbi:mitotic spindle checkpoint protein Bub3 [Phlyctochytrium planicorne]|nr:mitotic spindle checkpoint protein Bub3 [Phlyctochytrium planicorne]
MASADFELLDPPQDGISALSFCPHDSRYLLTVGLYDLADNVKRLGYAHEGAVLDVVYASSNHAYSGGLDRTLKCFDMTSASESILGSHDDAIKCVLHSPETELVYTGSWDRSIKTWDPRTSGEAGSFPQPSKVFSMDLVGNKLIAALAGRRIFIFDIRQMGKAMVEKGSSMKFMTRSVKCMPNGEGYALSSIEGRVAVEFFDEVNEKRKYAFKCHREKTPDGEIVHPVNALAFHPTFGTFASGGSDGVVSLWDGLNKKRLKQYPKYPTSISALQFSPEGRTLAIASSYTYEQGEKE